MPNIQKRFRPELQLAIKKAAYDAAVAAQQIEQPTEPQS